MDKFERWEDVSESEGEVQAWYQDTLMLLGMYNYIPNMAESSFLKQVIRRIFHETEEIRFERKMSPNKKASSEIVSSISIEAISQLLANFYGINFPLWKDQVLVNIEKEEDKEDALRKFYSDIASAREKSEML